MDPKKAIDVLEVLKDELPTCFRRGKEKRPLAHGVHESVIRYYAADSRFNQEVLKKAIELYVNGTKYLKNVICGGSRIDLYGKPISNITSSDRDYAKNILEARKKERLNYKYLEN